MRISGFTFARNAVKLYYPVVESIQSILPIVDEFVAVICPGDDDDNTRELVSAIGSDKVKIIDRPWPSDEEAFRAMAYSFLTNIALDACQGDWCLYLQADEVVHEDDLPVIKARCEELLGNPRVQGMLFDYLHFFGDYEHYQHGHCWYRREVRIIRKGIGLRSKGDAQSFRYPDGRKPRVTPSGGRVFHYGYVRPPHLMRLKADVFRQIRRGTARADEPGEFDYGPLARLAIFEGTHPRVMEERISRMDWQDKLRQVVPRGTRRPLHKEERLKYRLLSAVERWTGLDLNHKNYQIIRV